MTVVFTGPWQSSRVDEFLQQALLPVRLSCIGSDGFPRVVSLWYRYSQGSLYCVTHQSSKLVGILRKNPRVGFEIAADSPPYSGVRGQGMASLQPLGADPALENMLQRYLEGRTSSFSRWLLARSEEEILIAVKPHRMFSWDYRKRMSKGVD